MGRAIYATRRFKVERAFDYVSAGREYDFTSRSTSRTVDVRRTDGSGIGTYIAAWQFRQAIAKGWIKEVAA